MMCRFEQHECHQAETNRELSLQVLYRGDLSLKTFSFFCLKSVSAAIM
jgi:hypothetical protein